ncbi:MAG: diacylglycerol/polyprenol kinase family protein [Candidatus Zixiibacteriota bacterium]
MGALVIPGGYYLLRLDKTDVLIIMIPITILMILIDVSRLRQWIFWREFAGKIISPVIRHHEMSGDFTGATYILLSVCLTVALYDKPTAIAALTFVIVGDSLAAVIGRSLGRHKFGNKTVEGSLGCLVGTAIVAVLVPGLALVVGLFGAVTATIVEALPWQIDDNITVPILSGLSMTLFSKVLLNL